MSEEIASTNGLLIELARMKTDLAITRAALSQAERATEAERAARMRAEAVIDAARAHIAQSGIESDDRELMEAIEAYDRATKGNTTYDQT